MTRNDLDFAVGLAAKEGWNPGVLDADSFFQADPQGFLIGMLDDHPVACISAASYGGVFGFLGFYIVVPEHRGKGFGIRIWKAAMERLRGQVIGLDGVVAQQENYRKSGFALAYRNIRYGGMIGSLPVSIGEVIPLEQVDFEKLVDFDTRYFGFRRECFLKAWIQQTRGGSFATVAGDRITGYGAIRPCLNGYKVGPLFAEREADARLLLGRLASTVPAGSEFFLDVPEVNPAAVRLAEESGLKRVFETARMYKGPAPRLDVAGIYGVTTFELG